MGGCGSDIYKTIKKQHGQLFQKYIVGSQSLLEFKRLIRRKQQEYDLKVQNKRQLFHSEVKQRQSLMADNFKEVKLNLDAQLPGGVQSLQQMKKQSAESMLGYDEYRKRFAGVHEQVDREINQRRQKAHNQFEEMAKNAQQQYTIDPQKMKVFHEMSQERRTLVHDKGVKEFDELIKKRLHDLQTKNAQKLDLNVQLQRFNNVVSLQHVEHLVSVSKNKFRSQAISLAGGTFDSNIRI